MARGSNLKRRIDGPSITRRYSRLQDGTIVLNLIKKVTKKVLHPTQVKEGKSVEVTREAKITFSAVDPRSEDWIEDAITICGGDSALAAKVFNFGLWRFLQQQETNRLGKTDEVSKGLAKAIAGFVSMGMLAENARTMILANPDLASKLASQKFEQYIEVTVEDFSSYQSDTDEKGVISSRYPDITDVGEEKTDEEEK